MWEGLTALAELDLDNNKLLTIEPGRFYTLPRLSKLRLSGNQLNALNWNIFSTVQTGSLSDSSSDLTETPGSKTSHRHPSNLTLSLHDNPLVCNSDLCWLKQGEKDGWLKWYTAVKSLQLTFLAHKPHCANQPCRTWDNIILNCSGKSKMILFKKFFGPKSILWDYWCPLVRTSDDSTHWFQSHGEFILTCTLLLLPRNDALNHFWLRD